MTSDGAFEAARSPVKAAVEERTPRPGGREHHAPAVFAGVLGLLALMSACGAEVVAVVGGEVIDRRAFDQLWNLSRGEPPVPGLLPAGRTPEPREIVIELVKEELLRQEAARRGLNLGPGVSPREALAAASRSVAAVPEPEVERYFLESSWRFNRKAQVRFLHYRTSVPDVKIPRKLRIPELIALCEEASRSDPEGRIWGDVGWIRAEYAGWLKRPEWDPDLAGSTGTWRDPEGRAHLFKATHYRPRARFEFRQVAQGCRALATEEVVRSQLRRTLLRLAETTSIEIVGPGLPAQIRPEDIARSEPGPPLELLRTAGDDGAEPAGMVLIEGGTFTTGSTDAEIDDRVERCRQWVEPAVGDGSCARANYEDEVQRTVTVGSFWLDIKEVGWDDYGVFIEATRHRPLPLDGSGQPGYPVANVSFEDAEAYCRWQGRRLPTAVEWEFAARGPEGRRYPWGNEEPDGTRGNFCDANCEMKWRNLDHDDGFSGPAPPGSFPGGATPDGLQDMGGNLREWTGTRDGSFAQVKGGGFANAIDDLIAADVRENHVDTRISTIGFRCARAVGLEAPGRDRGP